MIEYGRNGSKYLIIDHNRGIQIELTREELKSITRHGIVELNIIDAIINTGESVFDKDIKFRNHVIEKWGITFISEMRRNYVRNTRTKT